MVAWWIQYVYSIEITLCVVALFHLSLARKGVIWAARLSTESIHWKQRPRGVTMVPGAGTAQADAMEFLLWKHEAAHWAKQASLKHDT